MLASSYPSTVTIIFFSLPHIYIPILFFLLLFHFHAFFLTGLVPKSRVLASRTPALTPNLHNLPGWVHAPPDCSVSRSVLFIVPLPKVQRDSCPTKKLLHLPTYAVDRTYQHLHQARNDTSPSHALPSSVGHVLLIHHHLFINRAPDVDIWCRRRANKQPTSRPHSYRIFYLFYLFVLFLNSAWRDRNVTANLAQLIPDPQRNCLLPGYP